MVLTENYEMLNTHIPSKNKKHWNIETKFCINTSNNQGGLADKDNSASWLRSTFLGRNITTLEAIPLATSKSLCLPLNYTSIELEAKIHN